jgi:hypothetical protein
MEPEVDQQNLFFAFYRFDPVLQQTNKSWFVSNVVSNSALHDNRHNDNAEMFASAANDASENCSTASTMPSANVEVAKTLHLVPLSRLQPKHADDGKSKPGINKATSMHGSTASKGTINAVTTTKGKTLASILVESTRQIRHRVLPVRTGTVCLSPLFSRRSSNISG